ncbi:MAG: MerR family transcriptional regulator [Corynebacterium sp.]|nr:MerR family transcriptional regulator [Corynebacterium sp.]
MADHVVQESLFEIGPDQEVGYRVPTACQVADITYRQLDYWARSKIVTPSIRGARGSGSQRLYSVRDILMLKIVKGLLDTGVALVNIRDGLAAIAPLTIDEMSQITLISDGENVYLCHTDEEILDAVTSGTGIFGIGIGTIYTELTGMIPNYPSEVPEVSEAVDELAAYRARKQA